MFCDLVGSTSLAEKLDPEDWLLILRSYQQACEEVASQYGGVIAKYIGDGVLIYFGHPEAHEDDPRRSILSGLGIIRDIKTLSKKLESEYGVDLQVRIGIHTGLVVIGQVGAGAVREENAIVGETPNIAARLQSLAQPDQLIISGITRERVLDLFTFEDMGVQPLRGVSHSVTVFRVLAEQEFTNSFTAKAKRGLTPLVGRSTELESLRSAWELASKGQGKTILVEGEAGIGKSRLLDAFKNNLLEVGYDRLPQEYFCSAYHTNSAFYPIVAVTSNAIQYSAVGESLTHYEKLERYLLEMQMPKDHAPVFAASMSIDLPEGVENNYKPDEAKGVISSDWIRFIEMASAKQPLFLVIEDIHWVDPSTRELIQKLHLLLADMPVLLILTSRPGGFEGLEIGEAYSHIHLQKLDNRNNKEIIAKIAGDARLPSQVVQHIIDRADGVPLYVEELTKAVLESREMKDGVWAESDNEAVDTFAIPSSLQDSLMSRLDKLSSIKEVVQVAATIGRRFTATLLKSVTDYSENLLSDALDRLIDAELIYEVQNVAEPTYEFKHALLQDAAYQSLLKSTRRHYHNEIARSLESNESLAWQNTPEIIAYHYTEAKQNDQAVDHWLLAGKKAAETSSHLEAVAHLEKGLELIGSLPAGSARDEREIELQTRYIGPLMTARGYTSTESEAAVNRAVELSKRVEECPQIFPILGTRYHFLQAAGQVKAAADVGEEFMHLAENQKRDDFLIVGYRLQGASIFLKGDAQSSLLYWDKISKLYDRDKHHSLAFVYGQDVNVLSMAYQSLALWHLGKEDDAVLSAKDALLAAEELNHPNTTCIALYWGAITNTLLDRPEIVITLCERLIKLCETLNIPLWLSVGNVLLGWAYCRTGNTAGVDRIEEGLSAYAAMKIGLFRPILTIAKSQALIGTGVTEQLIEQQKECIQMQAKGGETWLQSLSYSTLGDLILDADPSDVEQAREYWQTALDIATKQCAVSQQVMVTARLNQNGEELRNLA
jgi:class 3 adenylate cyclase